MSLIAAEKLKHWRDHPDLFVREVFKAIPDPWQDEVLKAYPNNQRIAMKASKGPGKDQPKSMWLDTPNGPRLWGNIKPGDKLFAPDGTETIVLETTEHSGNPQYRVTFDDGSFTICGLEHHWSVRGQKERTSKNQFVTLTTRQILERGVRVKNGKWSGRQFEIPIHDAVVFRKADQPLDPYVLGVWLGDGSKNSSRYTGIDKEVALEIVSRGYTLGKEYQNKMRSVLGITSALSLLGVKALGSHERWVPNEYKFASIQQRKDILSGLMDTDGCIGTDGSMEFDSTSPQLAHDIVWLVRSLGGNANIKATIKKPFYYDEDRNKIAGRDCFRVTLKLPFNPFKIQRKADRWKPAVTKSQTRYLTRYIDKIEFSHVEDSLCVKVDHPTGCYLTNDFIVTHNSTLLAWLAWNFLLTRPHPKIAATSISGDNLRDGLWAEMAKWMDKSPMLKYMFTWQKERIFLKTSPETWWMAARQWSKSADPASLGNTLAGLHADYIMFEIDEAGGIPEAIMAAADAALSSCVEGHIIMAGNPTHLEGPLYRACTVDRGLWHVVEITSDPDDPNRSPRVKPEWAREQISKYGRDNPWVLVNVFGRFPPSSFNALIGPEEVEAAMRRRYREPEFDRHPRILGIDVARFGDDSSIIFPRQGLQAFTPLQFRGLDGNTGAEETVRKWNSFSADACFIDNTGGFGASWIDNLLRLGKDPIGIHFSERATNPQYFNKRAEMAFELVSWVKRGGALPDIIELSQALTQTTYSFKGDQLLLEPKEDVKAKLNGNSPDHMDALMLTFALPVERKRDDPFSRFQHSNEYEYNPLSMEKIRG